VTLAWQAFVQTLTAGAVNLARVPVDEPSFVRLISVGLAVQAGNLVPGCQPDCPHRSVAGSGNSVSLSAKVSGYGIKDGEETLCLLR